MKRNYFVLEYDKDLVGITALKKRLKKLWFTRNINKFINCSRYSFKKK